MQMNIVLRIVENIQAILLACPVKYEYIWNISTFVLDMQACYASFILYTNTQGLAKDWFNNVGNIKRQETETSVFKS